MAMVSFIVDVQQSKNDGAYATQVAQGGVAPTVTAAIAAAIAAAGALHDSTDEITAISTACATPANDVVLQVDPSTVTSMNQLLAAIRVAVQAARASGKFT